MASQKLTTIQITEEDARLFVEFRKHHVQFKKLLENGVFDFFIGQKILHKDGLTIKIIETRLIKRF